MGQGTVLIPNDPVATGEQMQDATKYEINKYWNPTKKSYYAAYG